MIKGIITCSCGQCFGFETIEVTINCPQCNNIFISKDCGEEVIEEPIVEELPPVEKPI